MTCIWKNSVPQSPGGGSASFYYLIHSMNGFDIYSGSWFPHLFSGTDGDLVIIPAAHRHDPTSSQKYIQQPPHHKKKRKEKNENP